MSVCLGIRNLEGSGRKGADISGKDERTVEKRQNDSENDKEIVENDNDSENISTQNREMERK